MSLIYDEDSDIAEKDEEINMEKMDYFLKDKDISKNNKKNNKKDLKNEEFDDMLDQEALMNIPTKSLTLKNKKNKHNSKGNIKEIYDTSLEGAEIPLLSNNINNGSLMLTELLDFDNSKSKSKSNLNIVDDEKERIEKGNIFLKNKLENINIPISLRKGINSGIEKTHNEVHEDFKNDILNISKINISIHEFLSLKKSQGNIFLTRVEKIPREKMKRLKNLKLFILSGLTRRPINSSSGNL